MQVPDRRRVLPISGGLALLKLRASRSVGRGCLLYLNQWLRDYGSELHRDDRYAFHVLLAYLRFTLQLIGEIWACGGCGTSRQNN